MEERARARFNEIFGKRVSRVHCKPVGTELRCELAGLPVEYMQNTQDCRDFLFYCRFHDEKYRR